MSDEELALALKAGNERAFDELVRRFQGRVYAVAYRITSNREDALDVAQEALVKAYRKVKHWEPTGGFLPWLLRLTSNHAIDHLRRQKRQKHQPLDEAAINEYSLETGDEAPANTERALHAKEIGERVEASLHALSPTQRVVFVMRHYEGLPLSEIAESLGCTVGSVKVHLFRAMKKLQKELKPFRDEQG